MEDIRKSLLLLFDQPSEPCFMPKGDNFRFELPDNYCPDIYKKAKQQIGKTDATPIPVKNVSCPDLVLPMQLPMDAHFSVFIPKHQKMAQQLIKVFSSIEDLEELQSVCVYSQLRINPELFIYSLSVALLKRPDTKDIIPPLLETFPCKFIDSNLLARANKVLNRQSKTDEVVEIKIERTASEQLPEQRMAYFREDLGVNMHHWHWHLVYPVDDLTNKDRRGELFYYMHQQIINRYSVERLCNQLRRAKPFSNFREPIPEAYFPKLVSSVTGTALPPRFENSKLSDLSRPNQDIDTTIWMMEVFRDRIMKAIDTLTTIMPDGSRVPLDEETGIDVLGNMIEASSRSPNATYYGSFHNSGHTFISFAHDPENLYLEEACVLGDVATAMRDPVFYRWHTHINDLFVRYKNKLTPYSTEKLNFPKVVVKSIKVETAGQPENQFSTFWEQNSVTLKNGLDLGARGAVCCRFTYLQHEDFDYLIEVNNSSGKVQEGTVRIFMAPVNDDNGNPFTFEEQRKLVIELDKFSQTINPGDNSIRRSSKESSVTIPYETIYRDQSKRSGKPGSKEAAPFDFCGCGWPENLLIPKGTADGFPMVLFVMVSNWKDDKIEQEMKKCKNAASYCGLRDLKYPDKRAMGFPFDRPAPSTDSLEKFLQSNMAISNCIIKFTNTKRERKANESNSPPTPKPNKPKAPKPNQPEAPKTNRPKAPKPKPNQPKTPKPNPPQDKGDWDEDDRPADDGPFDDDDGPFDGDDGPFDGDDGSFDDDCDDDDFDC